MTEDECNWWFPAISLILSTPVFPHPRIYLNQEYAFCNALFYSFKICFQ